MSKQPTPKLDQLRAMRESRFKSAKLPELREKIANVPIKRAPKVKKGPKP